MAHPDPAVLAWASAALGSEVTVVRSLRLGGSPWLLRIGDRNAVLRVAAADPGLPVAELLGCDLAEQTGYALVLTGHLPGSSVIPAQPDPERLRALGAAL